MSIFSYKICSTNKNLTGKVPLSNKLLFFIVNILLRVMRVFPVRKGKILYWARNLNLYGNASALCQKWLDQPGTRHFYLTDGIKGRCLPDGSLDGVFLVPYKSISAIFHMATSSCIIKETDTISPPLYLRPEITVAQLWHASGAFKKFGLDVENRSHELKNYRIIDNNRLDFLLCSSRSIIDIYLNAFKLKNADCVYVDGQPKNDILYKSINNKDDLKRKYKFCLDKKVILFAPTFRDDHACGNDFSDLISRLHQELSDLYTVCIRTHPSCHAQISLPEGVINCSSFNPLEVLLAFTDVLITDYSSIIFDFACLKRPMIFYAPDLNNYIKERDFYFNYEKFVPGPICREADEIVARINDYNSDFWQTKITEFQIEYNPVFDGNASSRIINKIIQISNNKVDL